MIVSLQESFNSPLPRPDAALAWGTSPAPHSSQACLPGPALVLHLESSVKLRAALFSAGLAVPVEWGREGGGAVEGWARAGV